MTWRSWLQSVQQRWSGWVSDRDMERTIRARLNGIGYYGDTATFVAVRLVAIQRPGWVQVFSFTVDARRRDAEDREIVRLFGLVKQDERVQRCEVEAYEDASRRNSLFLRWSEGLITLRRPLG